MTQNEKEAARRAAEALAGSAYESEVQGCLSFDELVELAQSAGVFRYKDVGDRRGETIECEYVLTSAVIESARLKLAALRAQDKLGAR